MKFEQLNESTKHTCTEQNLFEMNAPVIIDREADSALLITNKEFDKSPLLLENLKCAHVTTLETQRERDGINDENLSVSKGNGARSWSVSEEKLHYTGEKKCTDIGFLQGVVNEYMIHSIETLSQENENRFARVTDQENDVKKTKLKITCQFLFYALGICTMYFISGLSTEKLFKGSFGPSSDHFSFVFTFLFVQALINFVYAELLLCTVFKNDEDVTERKFYPLVALTTFISMVLGMKSLTWISYPTQVLGKSMKPLPVMIFNVILGKQRYSFKKYFFVVLVVAGVSMFMITSKPEYGKTHSINTHNLTRINTTHMTNHKTMTVNSFHRNVGWGELLVFASLVFDGMTGEFIFCLQ